MSVNLCAVETRAPAHSNFPTTVVLSVGSTDIRFERPTVYQTSEAQIQILN